MIFRSFLLVLCIAELLSIPARAACTDPAPTNPCIPGGGLKSTDCRVEWLVTPPPAVNSKGVPKNTVVCYEGDPRCDLDPDLTNHSCTVPVALCINNTDPRFPTCTPSFIDTFEVIAPKATSADPADTANLAVLEAQLGSAGFGTSLARHRRVVTLGTRNATPNMCGDPLGIVVPQRSARGSFQSGTKTLTVQATATRSATDRDSLILQCRPSTCGNGIVDPYEECDDGNRTAGDGCDPWCHLELASGPAVLNLRVENDTGTTLTAEFSGAWLSGPPSDSAAVTYGPLTRSVPAGTTDITLDTSLSPGAWLHHLSVAVTGQVQHQQSLLVGDAAAANVVEWTLARTVLTVNQADDSGDGVCDATCTVRDAIQAATAAVPPVLIRFDHAAFPGAVARIQVTNNAAMAVRAAGTVIDGTDASGNPSPLADFGARIYPTIITLRAPNATPQPGDCPCFESPGGTLRVQAAGVRLQGLAIERQLAPQGQICCGDQDLVAFDAGSKGSRVDTCRLDGGAAAITDAEVPSGQTWPATGKDCVDADSTGATSAEPVAVDDSELRFCHDRGVKSRKGVVRLEGNWIHHNLRGGVFAQSPATGESEKGVIEAVGNLIEENGQNCPTGDASKCGAQQVVTRSDASELAAQGPLTVLQATDNVVRDGVLHGMYFQDQSAGAAVNDYLCGIGGKGMLIEKTQGTVADISVRGTAAVYNGDAGVKFEGNIAADFGMDGGASAGANAFAANGSGERRNFVNATDAPQPLIAAQGNQWEHCYPTRNATPDACDVAAISDNDTNNDISTQDRIDVRNPQPYQGSTAVQIAAVTPSKVMQGGLVWITGSGFDAVSGQLGAGAGDCHALQTGNSCNPLRGTCVEFFVDGTWTEALDVLAVTPTAVAVRSPATCAVPAMVRVKHSTAKGTVIASPPVPFCHN
jgi:cysteine-rich repeat protein